MKFKNCITRLFFRDPNPQRSYRLDEIIARLQTYGRDAYDVVRKSSFCVDLKEGCARGLGKVRSIMFFIFFTTKHYFCRVILEDQFCVKVKIGFLESQQELVVMLDVMTNSTLIYSQTSGFTRVGLNRKCNNLLKLSLERKQLRFS